MALIERGGEPKHAEDLLLESGGFGVEDQQDVPRPEESVSGQLSVTDPEASRRWGPCNCTAPWIAAGCRYRYGL